MNRRQQTFLRLLKRLDAYGLAGSNARTARDRHEYFDILRDVLRLYEDTARAHGTTGLNDQQHAELRAVAARALNELFPLTFDESEVVRRVQQWFQGSTAAPAFYVDQPTVRGTRVYDLNDIARAAVAWLRMVARHGVQVVLFDTVDKGKGRRLSKDGAKDRQRILAISEVRRLDRLAARHSIRALWAGGITLPQSYEFGRMGVFGVYVTTAVATSAPVGPEHESDPALAE